MGEKSRNCHCMGSCLVWFEWSAATTKTIQHERDWFIVPSSSSVMANRNHHTIILLQTSHHRATRTFMDFDSISLAIDGICGLYERKLKDLNPAVRNISYDIMDLYNFIDGLADMSALVYDGSKHAYFPYDREWIKERTFQHLKKLARWFIAKILAIKCKENHQGKNLSVMSAILPMAMLLDMIIAHTASSFYILYNISIASATEVSETNDYWQLAWLTLSL